LYSSRRLTKSPLQWHKTNIIYVTVTKPDAAYFSEAAVADELVAYVLGTDEHAKKNDFVKITILSDYSY